MGFAISEFKSWRQSRDTEILAPPDSFLSKFPQGSGYLLSQESSEANIEYTIFLVVRNEVSFLTNCDPYAM